MISVWEKDAFYRDTDILIAGGGLMGLWTAFELLSRKPGIQVTICESRTLPALASTRNAGFACFGSPSEVWADLQVLGSDAAWEVVDMRYRGIAKIRQVLGDTTIDFDACGGYELFNGQEGWTGKALQEKLDQLNQGFQRITGIPNMYTEKTEKIASVGLTGFSGMVANNVEGGLHSGKLIRALQQKVMQMGAIYLPGHEVSPSTDTEGEIRTIHDIQHGTHINLKAPVLVWATNAALGKLDALSYDVKPARGQVLLSPPVPGLLLQGPFHFDEGYYYFRNLGNRLLLGGARNVAFLEEETFEDQPSAMLGNVLRDFIRKHFPQVAPYAGSEGWMHWAGIMGMSRRKKPVVQALVTGQWAVLACNGMGVALTPVVAEMVADRVV